MRYELKIQLPEEYYDHVLKKLYRSRFVIREIYTERQINNIYFDTLGYDDYLSNYHGYSFRRKYRIRWYGELKGFIEKPALELKYKNGMVGGKESCLLLGFSFGPGFSYIKYLNTLKNFSTETDEKSAGLIRELLQRNPALVNCYARRYFMTGDGKCRLTLDKDMMFYDCRAALFNTRTVFGVRDPHMVIEVKFESEDLTGASNLINELGYRTSRNSKYVNGINAVVYNLSLR